MVYLQDDFHILPDRALVMPWEQIYEEILGHANRMLSLYSGEIHLWEAMNEMAQTNGVDMPFDAIIDLMADSAAQIMQYPDTHVLINAVHELNFGGKWRFYGADNQPFGRAKTLTTYTDFLKTARDRGALDAIDIIGMQFYAGFRLGTDFNSIDGPGFSPSQLIQVAEQFHQFGRPLHVTEFSVPSNYEETWTSGFWRAEWDEQVQADYLSTFLKMVLADPYYQAFTWWDITDNRSSLLTGGLLDETGRRKPVYYAFQDIIASVTTNTSTTTDSDGVVQWSGIGGDYDVTVVGPDETTATRMLHIGEREKTELDVVLVQPTGNTPPKPENRWITTVQGTPVGVVLTATDAEGDPLSFAVTGSPAHGAVTGTAPLLTYTPDAGFLGADTLVFDVSDGNGGHHEGRATVTVMPAPNQAPIAAFGYDVTERTLVLHNQSSDLDGSIVARQWNFGDGGVSLQSSPAHTYAADGVYGVTLVVTDNRGAQSAVTRNVRIKQTDTAPHASFAYSVSGSTVTFTDTSTDSDGSVLFWYWSFGDGSAPSNLQHPVHAYTGSGTYTVTLFVADDDGDGDTTTQEVLINNPPNAVFAAAVNGLTATFTDFSYDLEGPIASWAWNFGDGQFSNQQHPTHAYAAAGEYVVRLRVYDQQGAGRSTERTVIIEGLGEPPVADFSFNISGLDVHFSDDSTDADNTIVFWHWVFGDDSPPSNVPNPVHTYADGGTYTVTLFVADESSQSSSLSKTVTIDLAATAVFEATLDGLTVFFADLSFDPDGAITGWMWDFGDGATSQEQNPTHTYAADGSYVVRLTVLDANATEYVTEQTLAVVNDVRPPVADFDVSVSGNTAAFTDASVDPNGEVTFWHWVFGDDSPPSNDRDPTHTYSQPGTYTVLLFVADNEGESDSIMKSVTINTVPNAIFTVIVDDSQATFTDYSWDAEGAIAAWHWMFGDGGTSTDQNPVHAYAGPGDYAVALTVKDEAGAESTASRIVRVAPPNTAPDAAFGYSADGTRVRFWDLSVDPDRNIVYWYWNFGDGTTPSENPLPTHQYGATGNYNVTLYVLDAAGEESSVTASIGVDGDRAPVLTLLGDNPMSVAQGGAYEEPGATATSSRFGDISSGIVISGEVDPSTVGTYVVIYNVTDSRGNMAFPAMRRVYVEGPAVISAVADQLGGTVSRPGLSILVPPVAFPGTVQFDLSRVGDPDVELPDTIVGIVPSSAFDVAASEELLPGAFVTLELDYPDGDQDGIVDGTGFDERFLMGAGLVGTPLAVDLFPSTVDHVANTVTFLSPYASGTYFLVGREALCAVLSSYETGLDLFYATYGPAVGDLAGDGYPETYGLGLVREVACDLPDHALRDGLIQTYLYNLNLLETQDLGVLVISRELLAILLSMDASTQDAVLMQLDAAGIALAGDFSSVVVADNAKGAQGTGLKTIQEPFSASGDFDSDGTTNVTEYRNVRARLGSVNDFINAATDPTEDGRYASKFGCGGSVGGTIHKNLSDVLLLSLSLVLLAMVGRRRRFAPAAAGKAGKWVRGVRE